MAKPNHQQQHSRTEQILATIEHIHREQSHCHLSAVSFVRGPRPTATVVSQRMRVIAQVYELLVRNRRATKRDLFYEHKKLYGTQANFDRALSAICKHLNACRNELNVISCSRGFAIGNLRLFDGMDDDAVVDFRSSPVALVESLCHFNLVHSEAQFLLVVEKDAIFQRLIDEQFTHKFPRSILLTGRGYPDFCTRQFLHWLSIQLPALPMLVLVDADPYGVEIFLTYKYGSSRSTVEAGPLQLPRLKWLGFLPSEAQTLPIPHNQFLQLSEADRKRIVRIAQRMNSREDSDSRERSLFNYELSVMLNSSHKLELEALCSISASFLSTVYLDNKLLPLNVVSMACRLPHQNGFNSDQQHHQNEFPGNMNNFESDQDNDEWSDQNDDFFGSDSDASDFGSDRQNDDDLSGQPNDGFESDHHNDDFSEQNNDFDSDRNNDFDSEPNNDFDSDPNNDFDSDQD